MREKLGVIRPVLGNKGGPGKGGGDQGSGDISQAEVRTVQYPVGTLPHRFSARRKVSQVPQSCDRVFCGKGAAFHVWVAERERGREKRRVQEGELLGKESLNKFP